jgi:ATP-dependent DNA helicase RecG
VQLVNLSDADLEALATDLESDRCERKESLQGNAPTAVREAICSFANDLPDHRLPGVVFIGLKDDGKPSGLAIADELLLQLADMKSDGQIVPPPSMTVEKRRVHGDDVAVVTVLPSDAPPVRFKGRIRVRTGPRRDTATAQDERLLNERRRFGDRPFDVQPVSTARLDDLDRRRFEYEYLPAAVAPDVLAANDRTYEQRLAATKMVVAADEPVPTVLGLLVLGHRTRDFLPGAYVQFLRLAGRDLSDPIADEQAIDGPITELLRRLDEKLQAHNRTAVDLKSRLQERRTPLLPLAALQQITRNAVMHRTYEGTNAPVRVTWYDDRVEILSPGGPYGTVTAQNFGTPGLADYRNPSLAEALRGLGFVQRFGVGIATARRELDANGNPPLQFAVDTNNVGVILRVAS